MHSPLNKPIDKKPAGVGDNLKPAPMSPVGYSQDVLSQTLFPYDSSNDAHVMSMESGKVVSHPRSASKVFKPF